MAEKSTTPKTVARTIVQFTGHSGTRRIISKADQNRLVGAPVATHELEWEPGNTKLDVTDLGVHDDVMEYLKNDNEFKISTVDVPAENL